MLLGGTRDALQIAESLIESRHSVIYSIAGLAGNPSLNCRIYSGGFGGVSGLVDQLGIDKIDCLIDATHPYAQRISTHAARAAAALSLPLLRYTRPPWQPVAGDNWIRVDGDWPSILSSVLPYRRPFFTIGHEPLSHRDDIPQRQQWLVRTLCLRRENAEGDGGAQMRILSGRGPFDDHGERALMALGGVDVLVSKNSGGRWVAPKITAARDLRIPVSMLRRPSLAPVANEFDCPNALLAAVITHCNRGQ